MTDRKKRLIFIQIFIVSITVLITFKFYFNNKSNKTILSDKSFLKSNEQNDQNSESKNLFSFGAIL